MMFLQRLTVNRIEYGEDKGQYRGEIKFDDQSGSLSINLDNGLSEKVLSICADALRAQASKTAEIMCATAIPQQLTMDSSNA